MKGSGSDFRTEISDLRSEEAACKLFRLEVQTGGRNDWLGIEMRCAACAAAKAQNFSSREIAATNLPVRLKSAARSRPDSMATQCVAERRSPVTASSSVKSRRSSASTLSSKDNFGITSSGPHGRKESQVKTFCSCLSAAWIMLSIARDFRLRGGRRVSS